MSSPEIFTEWREERLYVLRTIEDLKDELRRQSEAAAVSRANVEEKAQRDIKAAHDKIRVQQDQIRDLQSSGVTMGIKNWIMTVALSIAGAIGFELVKALMGK